MSCASNSYTITAVSPPPPPPPPPAPQPPLSTTTPAASQQSGSRHNYPSRRAASTGRSSVYAHPTSAPHAMPSGLPFFHSLQGASCFCCRMRKGTLVGLLALYNLPFVSFHELFYGLSRTVFFLNVSDFVLVNCTGCLSQALHVWHLPECTPHATHMTHAHMPCQFLLFVQTQA